jgi:hypothetical protein
MPGKAAASSARTDVIEALLIASRAMAAIASRSLADIDRDVTLTQSRVPVGDAVATALSDQPHQAAELSWSQPCKRLDHLRTGSRDCLHATHRQWSLRRLGSSEEVFP